MLWGRRKKLAKFANCYTIPIAGGCSYEDGRLFFRALFNELVPDPANPFEVVTVWQDWKDQLGI